MILFFLNICIYSCENYSWKAWVIYGLPVSFVNDYVQIFDQESKDELNWMVFLCLNWRMSQGFSPGKSCDSLILLSKHMMMKMK